MLIDNFLKIFDIFIFHKNSIIIGSVYSYPKWILETKGETFRLYLYWINI